MHSIVGLYGLAFIRVRISKPAIVAHVPGENPHYFVAADALSPTILRAAIIIIFWIT